MKELMKKYNEAFLKFKALKTILNSPTLNKPPSPPVLPAFYIVLRIVAFQGNRSPAGS